jgi:ergothioneine biosynthesis protein EgtB
MPGKAVRKDDEEQPSLAATYLTTRHRSEALAAPLSSEDQNIQSMPDASPTKWHLAHTSWFFEAVVLAKALPDYVPFDARYAYLFNSYYEGLGPRHPRPQRGMLSRPSAAEVLAYRRHVDVQMLALLDTAAEHIASLATLGMHHEQQHQELILTDIKHALFLNPLLPTYEPLASTAATHAPSALAWHAHPGGIVSIGHGGDDFAYDNERPRHEVLLRPFVIASRPVTNGEYLAFIDDGGYRRPEFWLSDAWALVQREVLSAPLYWLGEPDGWFIL